MLFITAHHGLMHVDVLLLLLSSSKKKLTPTTKYRDQIFSSIFDSKDFIELRFLSFLRASQIQKKKRTRKLSRKTTRRQPTKATTMHLTLRLKATKKTNTRLHLV